MLVAVVRSPMMIRYLDQHNSMGPNSRAGLRRARGINENLARELLELHAQGVNGGYTQTDVQELAALLTGVSSNAREGMFFNPYQAEPGPETVLGKTYGGTEEAMEHVLAALHDLAFHCDTALHLAHGGVLLSVYEVMLRADVAWQAKPMKVKQPFDLIASSVRALGVPLDVLLARPARDVTRRYLRPMTVMGQAWTTPTGMAGRITWAMRAPSELLADLPAPRDFVYHALGPTPHEAVIFAAGAAETVSDGLGLVLASGAFQRR